MYYPKIIWCLWLQGWANAPKVVQSCLMSWKRLNPEYTIHVLDKSLLEKFIPHEDLCRIYKNDMEPEAQSDLIRIELLNRYGGIWADATTMCTRSLDKWLPESMNEGFFAFELRGTDRIISSWFLASSKGNYIICKWRQCVHIYWRHRETREQYFWFHNLFKEAYNSDMSFREIWDRVPKQTANHIFHFSPNDPRLIQEATPEYISSLTNPPSPVFKLTHKIDTAWKNESLIKLLYDFGTGKLSDHNGNSNGNRLQNAARIRVLVTWYGTFKDHGTLGDLRSFECVVTHLVALGCQVMYASSYEIDFPNATSVIWEEIGLADLDGIVFVCGPIILNHRETKSLFERFQSKQIIGVAVSLFPKEHFSYFNPFDVVFARQGVKESYGDVAILANHVSVNEENHEKTVIGISLRGIQGEYGEHLCKWQAVEEIVTNLIKHQDWQIIRIENKLANSGILPDEIESLYATCDLVITTRYHGAIMALKYNVPFIAIDQIEGGAKVFELLQNLKWPYTYKIENMDTVRLLNITGFLLSNRVDEKLKCSRDIAIGEANKTLEKLDEWINSVSKSKVG